MRKQWMKWAVATVAVAFLLGGTVPTLASASVEVNRADQAELDGIRGVGPRLSRAILAERKRGGEFASWSDLEKRVKGVKGRSARRLSENGLTVHGVGRSGREESSAARAPDQGMQRIKGGG